MTRVAYALVHDDPPRVYLADDEFTLSRVLALELVAATGVERLAAPVVSAIRSALLEERWADAVLAWIDATGVVVDAYPSEKVWSAEQLDEERTTLELRVARIFEDHAGNAE